MTPTTSSPPRLPPSILLAPAPPQPGRNAHLCILALPADMGFAELCTFMGAYFQHVSQALLSLGLDGLPLP